MLIAGETTDELRGVSTEVVLVETDLAQAPADTMDAYLRLHLLSHRLVTPRSINLDGIFAVLPNVAWTSAGPCAVDGFEDTRARLRASGRTVAVYGVDKFPRMTDYVVPSGVRIADADRVRLGAYLAPGTTVMQAGFVNFNAGTLGTAMVEGRITAGTVVGADSDIGAGTSLMGTLSGGGTEQVTIGERCLIGANAGIGISLGDDCVIEAGCYVTAGTKVTLPDGAVVKASSRCPDRPAMLFRRNSVTGAVEVLARSGPGISLNPALHATRELVPAAGFALIVVLVVLVTGVVVVALLGRSGKQSFAGDQCIAVVNGADATLDLEQTRYASIIVAGSVKHDMPPRAATIALATALQESDLRNLDHGHARLRRAVPAASEHGVGHRGTDHGPVLRDGQVLRRAGDGSPTTPTSPSPTLRSACSARPTATPTPSTRAAPAILASALTGQTPAAFTCTVAHASPTWTTGELVDKRTAPSAPDRGRRSPAGGATVRVPIGECRPRPPNARRCAGRSARGRSRTPPRHRSRRPDEQPGVDAHERRRRLEAGPGSAIAGPSQPSRSAGRDRRQRELSGT